MNECNKTETYTENKLEVTSRKTVQGGARQGKGFKRYELLGRKKNKTQGLNVQHREYNNIL